MSGAPGFEPPIHPSEPRLDAEPRLDTELADWWPLFPPPSHYAEEAAHLLALLEPAPGRCLSLLELGCGGGSLASHLAGAFDLTLTKRAPAPPTWRARRRAPRFRA